MIGSVHWRSGLVTGAILVGCAGQISEESPRTYQAISSCSPVGVPLSVNETMAYMAGRYRVVMITDNGRDRVAGVLDLEGTPEGYQDWGSSTATLSGTADVNLGVVGAQQMRGLASSDPAAPGALVLESEGSSGQSIFLRFGSEANRREGEIAFDAAFTVLDVGLIEGDRFAGIWRSGVNAEWVEGYFCAYRIRH